MTPERLAALHAAAATSGRPWTAADFAATLADPAALLVHDAASFALGRVAVDEAELLLIATDPARQREGRARARLAAYESGAAARGATRSFLEVAATNEAARALYRAAGYETAGERPAYYRTRDGDRVSAILMAKNLTDWSKS